MRRRPAGVIPSRFHLNPNFKKGASAEIDGGQLLKWRRYQVPQEFLRSRVHSRVTQGCNINSRCACCFGDPHAARRTGGLGRVRQLEAGGLEVDAHTFPRHVPGRSPCSADGPGVDICLHSVHARRRGFGARAGLVPDFLAGGWRGVQEGVGGERRGWRRPSVVATGTSRPRVAP